MKAKNDIEIVADLVKKLMKGFHAIAHKMLNEEGLSLSQYYTLCLIDLGSQVKMGEIKSALGVSGAYATGIADKLIEKGLIKRQWSREDHRVVITDITDKGKKFIKRMEKKRLQFYSLLFSKMNGKDKKTVKDGLSLFVSCFEDLKKEYI